MRQRPFGRFGTVSALSMGGGGIGQVWGATTRDEAVAIVRDAVAASISFIDVAPSYGKGEAEDVIDTAQLAGSRS
jgi:aryl-alcohol dehydrogenase-like predicted oxidoreductase